MTGRFVCLSKSSVLSPLCSRKHAIYHAKHCDIVRKVYIDMRYMCVRTWNACYGVTVQLFSPMRKGGEERRKRLLHAAEKAVSCHERAFSVMPNGLFRMVKEALPQTGKGTVVCWFYVNGCVIECYIKSAKTAYLRPDGCPHVLTPVFRMCGCIIMRPSLGFCINMQSV